VLVWQAPTQVMNPAVPADIIAEAYAEDEAAAAAEYGAEFRRDIESFLSKEAIAACVVPDRFELPPIHGQQYIAFIDPSGGSSDSMTLAIATRDTNRSTLVCVREVKAPFSPDIAVADFVTALQTYGVRSVTSDRYAGEWPRDRFRRFDIECRPSDKTKSEIYVAFAPLVNACRVELLDLPVLTRQLEHLERRTSRGGKDSIDHPPRGRDDVANAVAGALVNASRLGSCQVGTARIEQFL